MIFFFQTSIYTVSLILFFYTHNSLFYSLLFSLSSMDPNNFPNLNSANNDMTMFGGGGARWPGYEDYRVETPRSIGSTFIYESEFDPFFNTDADTIMEAVRQGFQLQLDSTRNRTIEMISESYETTTIVFLLETASCGYLTHLNRNPNEGVMTVLQKSRRTGEGVQREHPGGCFAPYNSPDRVNHPRLSF